MSQETLQNVQQIASVVLTVIATAFATIIVPAAVKLTPIILTNLAPLVSGMFRNHADQMAFNAVSRAGIRAASVAADTYAKLMADAARPESPSGTVVDDSERAAAIKDALDNAWAEFKRSGITDEVIAAYGGQDAVRAAITAIVRNALFGTPHGVSPAASLLAVDQPNDGPISPAGSAAR